MNEKDTVIVLHLGLHKTGTSFLQYEVFKNMEGVNLLIKPYDIRNIHIEKGRINILTGEGFSRSLPHWGPTSREETLHHLKKLFPDAKIIVGFRERGTWLRSCYGQYVTGYNGKLSFEKYIDKYQDSILSFSDYQRKIEDIWEHVFVYHQETLESDIGPMCKFIGCPVPDYESRIIHRSLTKRQLFVYRIFNIIFGKFGVDVRKKLLKMVRT